MFCVTITLLLVIPEIAFAQQLLEGGHRSGASEIKCPKLACHLHNYPQEHCKVQTFFVYHGVRCTGCTEDICYGSQAVADSLIGNDVAADSTGHPDMAHAHSHGGTDRRHLPGEWNRFNGIRARLIGNQVPAHQRTSSFIFGPNRQTFGQPNVHSIARDNRGPSSRKTITCPKIECELHHKPKEHCIVESYFLYQGRRCAGCIEDICLGAQTVQESLIGKNDTAGTDLHTGEAHTHQDMHSEKPDVPQKGQIDRSFQRPNSNSQSPMRQMFENNRNTFRGNTLRTNSNLNNRNSPWTQNRNRTNNFRSFGQRDGGRTSNWRTNDRNLMSSSTTNNRQDNPTAQQLLHGGHMSDAPKITCPKVSCHLHHYPQEHCKIQTFLVYHGISCKGCIEDICHGSQTVADSLIGNDVAADSLRHTDISHPHSHGGSDRHQRPRVWNRFNGRRASLFSNLFAAFLRTLGLVRGSNRRTFGQHNVHSIARDNRNSGSKHEITCPKMECDLHHKPREHCKVESYFLYQGKRCAGCTEDICLGEHKEEKSLIGKNDTVGLHTGESHMHHHPHSERSEVPHIGQIDRRFQRHNSNSQSPMRQMFGHNRNTFRGNTFRTNSNLINRNSPWTHSRDHFNSFGQRNVGRSSTWRTNDRNLMSSSTSKRRLDSLKSQNRQDSQTGNTEDIIVIKEEPTSPLLNNGRGIQRYTGSARTYLQSLFHPAFIG